MSQPLYRFARDRMTPGTPFAAAEALSNIATDHHAPAALRRGGPFGRASRLVERGAPVSFAAFEGAKQGKGHFGELSQSIQQTVSAALVDAPHVARMNPVANDPAIDVEVLVGSTRVAGHQLKVGSPEYVARSVRKRPYQNVIVNEESIHAVRERVDDSLVQLSDRLSHEGVDSETLRADHCAVGAAASIERMLLGLEPVGPFEVVAASLLAGGKDGVVSFAVELSASIGHALITGEPFGLVVAIENAATRAAKAAAKTTLQSHGLLTTFLEQAGPEYSAHVLRRVALRTIVAGAIAEVAVETAMDIWRVFRGRMTVEDMARRFGVHVFSAGGAALGGAAALVLTRGAHPIIQILAALGLGFLGGHLGSSIGQQLFLPTPTSPTLLLGPGSFSPV